MASCDCRPDTAQLTAVLDALHALCAEGQVMVDLFVNYDCDLQAANLFERSMKGLSKLLKKASSTSVFAAQQASKTRDVALDAVLAMLKSLNTWAEPLKVRPGSANITANCKRVCRLSVVYAIVCNCAYKLASKSARTSANVYVRVSASVFARACAYLQARLHGCLQDCKRVKCCKCKLTRCVAGASHAEP